MSAHVSPPVQDSSEPAHAARDGHLSHSWAWILELLVAPLMLVYCELVLRLFAGSPLWQGLGFAVLFACGYGFALNFLASFFSRRLHTAVVAVGLFVAGLLYTIESIIFASFQVYMNFATILGAAGDVTAQYTDTLLSSIAGGLPRIACFMAPCAVYLVACVRLKPERPRGAAPSLATLAFTLVFCLAGHGASTVYAEAAYASRYEFDTATQTFGLLTSLRLDAWYAIFGNDAADALLTQATAVSETEVAVITEGEEEEEEVVYGTNAMDIDFAALAAAETDEDVKALDEYVASLTASSQNEYTGIFEGKNLILICAEAFSGAIISEKLTPTLYRLQHEGIYFSEYYQPAWGGSTSTGEYSFLMGLVPVSSSQSIINTIGNNNYFTLANQLQRLGYFTLAFHNGSYTYYSRHLTHYNLGFDIWLGNGNGIEDIAGSYTTDKVTMNAMLECFLDEEPFCVYFMTVSGHASYVQSYYTTMYMDQVVAAVGEGAYSDRVMYYLCYQMALEDMLTDLVATLEEEGIADDTVICLTTDHYPYGLSQSSTYNNPIDYMSELNVVYSDSYSFSIPWERDRNALILWSGCLEEGGAYEDLACEISEPTYSLDIVPTLSNLFGLEYDSRLLVGRDVFSDEEAIVVWLNASWVTVQGTYNASTGVFTPNEGYEYDEEYVARINAIVAAKISYSRQVVALDYYGILFGEDDVGNDGSNGNLVTLTPRTTESEDDSSDDDSTDEDATS